MFNVKSAEWLTNCWLANAGHQRSDKHVGGGLLLIQVGLQKKRKKKKITFIYVCTKLENTIQNTTTCLNQLCQCCGYESCFVEKLTMTHFQVLKVRTHMSGSETNLNPVKDPLVVSLVLDQSVQLSGQICSAELLLLVLLRLIAQCKLHILQRERERGIMVIFHDVCHITCYENISSFYPALH